MYIAKTKHITGCIQLGIIDAVICDTAHLEKHQIKDYEPDQPIDLCYSLERRVLTRQQMLCVPKPHLSSYLRRISADRSSQKLNQTPIGTRTDINVFVVDTGINKLPGLNVVGGYSVCNDNCYLDSNGHGTHIAGIIGGYDQLTGLMGVVPGVRLWSVKITNNSGLGMLNSILRGLDWIYQNKDKVWHGHGIVNISMAGGINKYLDEAVTKLTQTGIIVCAAAGNFGGNADNYSPAHCPDVITVGATYQADYSAFAIYSNHGRVIDILAPGSDIYSLYDSNNYAIMSGTSMACPVVTGTVALMLSSRNIPGTGSDFVKRVKAELLNAAYPIQSKNADNTITNNNRIAMNDRIRNLGTTDVCVKAGCF